MKQRFRVRVVVGDADVVLLVPHENEATVQAFLTAVSERASRVPAFGGTVRLGRLCIGHMVRQMAQYATHWICLWMSPRLRVTSLPC